VAVQQAPEAVPAGAGADDDIARLKALALRILARREHSRIELERKLMARFGNITHVGTVLDELQAQNCLSDQRFVEHYIDQRCRKGFGPLRIRAELAERGVSTEEIGQGFDAAAIDWDQALRLAAERKFGASAAEGRQGFARRGRFLEQRGFPIGSIRRYLNHIAAS
jgi:regulatory protein